MIAKLDNPARALGVLFVISLGGWILHSYLGLLAWAIVLAIATWPVYQKLREDDQGAKPPVRTALILTVAFALIILGPISYGVLQFVREAQALSHVLVTAQNAGVAAPDWLSTLPWIGARAKSAWDSALGTPDAARETLHWLQTGSAMAATKTLASQIMHRFFGILITLLALFFVYRDGERLGLQVLASSRKLFGEVGVRYAVHAAQAVRATVNGLVLVGLGEGLLLGFGYAVAGLEKPAMLGAITGVMAMIPFAAKLIFGACAVVLIAQGHAAAGIGLLAFGIVIILVADNYVRPMLIGGAVKLPFLWTLLGIFGGLENFGLLGLFLGPTVMAALISLWRDWTSNCGEAETLPAVETIRQR
jgi:predicted PurR-regulated permease PerM